MKSTRVPVFVLLAVLFAPAYGNCQYLNAALSNEVRFNDRVAGVNGQPNLQTFVTGDTWACAWADDGLEYCTFNDGTGVATTQNPNPPTSNIGLIALDPSGIQVSNVNAMSGFGSYAQANTNGWTDGATWKTAGVASAYGSIYVTVQRQADYPPWAVANASIIKSSDHGVTWCNSLHATFAGCSVSDPNGDPPGSGQAMWSAKFAGPTLVTYCQDNSVACPSVDGNDTYFYLTSLGVSYESLYLLRVKKSDFPLLDVTKYQYWVGGHGNNITNEANWSPSYASASPVLQFTADKFQVYYIAGLSQYVLINDTEHGMFEIWNAATLSGPWFKSAVLPADEEDAALPGLNLSSVQVINTNPATITVRMQYGGDYTTAPQQLSFPLTSSYSLHWKTLMLSASNTPAQSAAAATFSDQLPGSTVMLADYAFLPELGTAVTDYSGSHNYATSNSQLTYTNQAVWLNEQNGNGSGDIISANIKSSRDFTFILVFRKLQAPLDNECLFTDTGGAFSLCRVSAASQDTYTLKVSGQSAAINLLDDGAWSMLAVVRSGPVMSVYTSNALLGSAFPAPAASVALTDGFSGITGLTLGKNFSGQIARFVFYDVGMSPVYLPIYANAVATDVNQRGIYLGRPIAVGEYPLDSQPPLAAWSVRRLVASYTGPALNVVTADDASMDVGFTTSGDVDVASLLQFCDTQSCFVAKWYDQSGNQFDLTSKFGFAHLATIVNSGVPVTCGTNTKTCVAFDGTEEYVTPPGFYFYGLTAAASSVFQMNVAASGPWAEVLGFLDPVDPPNIDAASWLPILRSGTSSNLTWIRGGITTPGLHINTNTAYSVFSISDSYYQRFGADDNFASPSTLGFGPPFAGNARLQFNTVALGAPGFVGSVAESVVWGSSVPYFTVRALGNSQNSYFGTTQSWP